MGSQGKQNPKEIAHASVNGSVQNLLTSATCDKHTPFPKQPGALWRQQADMAARTGRAQLPGGHLQADGADDAQEHDLAE